MGTRLRVPGEERGAPQKCDRSISPYLDQRWNQGCRNAAHLWREIRDRGFSGTSSSLRQWVFKHYDRKVCSHREPLPRNRRGGSLAPAHHRRPFRHEARFPQVKTHSFTVNRRIYATDLWSQERRGHWPARPVRQRLLSGSCSSARRFAPRFLPTLGRPHAVALRFTRCDLLVTGLVPVRVRPCWAHHNKAAFNG